GRVPAGGRGGGEAAAGRGGDRRRRRDHPARGAGAAPAGRSRAPVPGQLDDRPAALEHPRHGPAPGREPHPRPAAPLHRAHRGGRPVRGLLGRGRHRPRRGRLRRAGARRPPAQRGLPRRRPLPRDPLQERGPAPRRRRALRARRRADAQGRERPGAAARPLRRHRHRPRGLPAGGVLGDRRGLARRPRDQLEPGRARRRAGRGPDAARRDRHPGRPRLPLPPRTRGGIAASGVVRPIPGSRGVETRTRRQWRRERVADSVGDFVLRRLRDWGVEQVFAYPGDGINGLVAAFGAAGDRPRFVQSRHEEMSALQAVGYAKFSGQVGVCMATSGPGAIHLLNGLYDAKLDHVPVVAIVGQTERSAMGGSYQQEVDLQALLKDVASDYLVEVNVAEQLPNAVDRAFRTALTRRAPTAIIIPSDLQGEPYTPPRHEFKQVPSSEPGLVAPTLVPAESELARAAEVLNAGQQDASLAGQGARGAAAEVERVADVLGAGVAKALLGKDVLSDELPFVTGSIGLLGTRPSYELMRDCDTLLIVGSSFPYSQFLPEFGQARAVQI